MASTQKRLLLAVVATDCTFTQRKGRDGQFFWQGKCIHCGSALVVEMDGSAGREVTLEHIFPKAQGGDSSLKNLALACRACNNMKGVRQDVLKPGNPAFDAMVAFLQKRRQERWRQPLPELESCCEAVEPTGGA